MMIRAAALTVFASGCYASMHHEPVVVHGYAAGYVEPQPVIVEPAYYESYGSYGYYDGPDVIVVETGWCDYGGHRHWHDGHARWSHHRHWSGDAHAAAPHHRYYGHDGDRSGGGAYVGADPRPAPTPSISVPNRPYRDPDPSPGPAPAGRWMRPEPRPFADRGARPEPAHPIHPVRPDADVRPDFVPPSRPHPVTPARPESRPRPEAHPQPGIVAPGNPHAVRPARPEARVRPGVVSPRHEPHARPAR